MVLFIHFFRAKSYCFREPHEAFKTTFTQNEKDLNIKLELGKDIYLYDDKIKIFILKPQKIEITEEINILLL